MRSWLVAAVAVILLGAGQNTSDLAKNDLDKLTQAPNRDSFRDIVEACNRKFIEDFKKGDMLAVARGYADDATIYFPRGKSIHGREAIDRYWQKIKGAKDWKLETLEVGGTPQAIYEIGKSSLTTEADGKERTYVCDYIVIWKRQTNGTYLTYADIFN
jgi:ketosteroid isomerase-like protein